MNNNLSDPNFLSPQDTHMLYMLLFNLILRHDDRLRLDVAEAIRRILQNPIPNFPLSHEATKQLRHLRAELLASPQPEIVDLFSQPPVRPVK